MLPLQQSEILMKGGELLEKWTTPGASYQSSCSESRQLVGKLGKRNPLAFEDGVHSSQKIGVAQIK
jgi:hypothetical protein